MSREDPFPVEIDGEAVVLRLNRQRVPGVGGGSCAEAGNGARRSAVTATNRMLARIVTARAARRRRVRSGAVLRPESGSKPG